MMSIYGYLGCWQCRQYVFLGKWLRNSEGSGLGFWHGSLGSSQDRECLLGRMALRFIAAHLNHDVRSYVEGSEQETEAEDFLDVEAEFALAARSDVDET
ncbi:MAG: hypothetical protein K1Y36_01270 [Blastocatellia bacterium]|nr:hypothetical protein [Blastocatellia bacterium]